MAKDKIKSYRKEINLHEGITVRREGDLIFVKGPKGEVNKKFIYPGVKFEVRDNSLILDCIAKKQSKKFKTIMGTFSSHIRNMIKGVTDGYTYKLKVCSGHFPISVSVEGDKVLIKNFFGEKVPRKAKIISGVKVKVEGDVVFVEGIDKESTGQTTANIEQATRVTKRDRRVFQDGVWIFLKGGKDAR